MRYVAFLRGINLGNRRLSMSRLVSLFEELGFQNVSTFIASGNVIFDADLKSQLQLEKHIPAYLEKELGYEVETFIRAAAEVEKIAAFEPFPGESVAESKIHVAFLHSKLSPAVARDLAELKTDYDAFRVSGSEFYWLTRGPISQSKVWTLPSAKELKLPSFTMRNMNTVQKLVSRL